MDPHFKQDILLLAEILVPDLQNNTALEYAFIKNFKLVFQGLEKDSSNKIKLLVKVIKSLSYLYNFKAFEDLNYKEREKYIDKLFHFPIPKIVAGLTGLRSLIFISFYGIEEIWASINYDGPLNYNQNE